MSNEINDGVWVLGSAGRILTIELFDSAVKLSLEEGDLEIDIIVDARLLQRALTETHFGVNSQSKPLQEN